MSSSNWLTIGFNKKYNCFRDYNLSVEIETPTLESIILPGTGDVTMKGFLSIDKLSIDLIGTGNFIGFDTTCKQCTVTLSGTGDCSITASEKLDVTITGAGNVFYKGNPTITQNITGVGSVIEAN